MRKIVSAILCIILVSNLVFGCSQSVNASENEYVTYVYVEGLEYRVELNEEKNITVSCVTPGYKGEMLLDENLNGEININRNEQYEVEIGDLNYSDESVDIMVYEGDEVVGEYDECDEFLKDEYSGQMSIAVGSSIAVGTLLTALFYACLAVTIGGVVCYAVDAVIDDVSRNSKYYYRAYRMNNTVFINPNVITKRAATTIIACGGDTYTYTSGLAKSVVAATGLGVTESENHWAWYKVGSFFSHYHTANRNGAHSFYGIPR